LRSGRSDVQRGEACAAHARCCIQQPPCPLRQSVEVTLAAWSQADLWQNFFIEHTPFQRVGGETDSFRKALYLLLIGDRYAPRTRSDRRSLVPNSGKHPKSQQQVMHILDQAPRV
jgi:hypothetical protein